MKSLKEYYESKSNGKQIANEIIVSYFGSNDINIKDVIKDKIETDVDIDNLIFKMQDKYMHDENSKDPNDIEDLDIIHDELFKWIKMHNK